MIPSDFTWEINDRKLAVLDVEVSLNKGTFYIDGYYKLTDTH